MTQSMESNSEKETWEIGNRIAQQCEAGTIVLLHGDLGVGKTVFTKGFAAGLGVEEPVNSPTFTIIQIYESGRLPLYHFDVYRIGVVEEMYDIGIDEYLFGDGVCLIEWPSRIEEILPDTCENIWIEKDLEKGFDYRRITCDKEGDRES